MKQSGGNRWHASSWHRALQGWPLLDQKGNLCAENGGTATNFGDVQSMFLPTTKDTVAERMKLLLYFCREWMLKVEVTA